MTLIDRESADLSDVDDEVLDSLHTKLTGQAQAEGVLDVAYRTVDSPVGRLLLAATPKGLVRVAFESEDHNAVLESLATAVSPRVLAARGGSTRSPGNSTSTSRPTGAGSGSRSTSGWRRASGVRSSTG